MYFLIFLYAFLKSENLLGGSWMTISNRVIWNQSSLRYIYEYCFQIDSRYRMTGSKLTLPVLGKRVHESLIIGITSLLFTLSKVRGKCIFWYFYSYANEVVNTSRFEGDERQIECGRVNKKWKIWFRRNISSLITIY